VFYLLFGLFQQVYRVTFPGKCFVVGEDSTDHCWHKNQGAVF